MKGIVRLVAMEENPRTLRRDVFIYIYISLSLFVWGMIDRFVGGVGQLPRIGLLGWCNVQRREEKTAGGTGRRKGGERRDLDQLASNPGADRG